jgi:hypothetical protein
MTWRRLRPGEIDHEALWLAVSIGAIGGAWLWLDLALPTPECPFHRLTGFPCPTCGVTRCLRYTFHHDWRAATGINPLAFIGLGAVALYDMYAASVLLFRQPRLRFEAVSARLGRLIRYGTMAAILGNWAWLVWMRV